MADEQENDRRGFLKGLFTGGKKLAQSVPSTTDMLGAGAEGVEDASTKKEMTRREFLQTTGLIGAGALLAGTASCKPGDSVNPNDTLTIGRDAVYYGADKNNADLRKDLEGFHRVTLQPADNYVNAKDLPKNGQSYASLCSLVPVRGLPTDKLWDDINAIGGFLKDGSGNLVMDPTNGNVPKPVMVDIRKPAVYALMYNYIMSLPGQHLLLDSMDAVTRVENYDFEDPTQTKPTYVGVPNTPYYKRFRNDFGVLDPNDPNSRSFTAAGAALFNDINLAKGINPDGSGRTAVIGGFFQSFAYPNASNPDVIDPIPHAITGLGCDNMYIESQYRLRADVKQSDVDPGANAWTEGRLKAFAKAAKANGRDNFKLTFLEPVNTITPTVPDAQHPNIANSFFDSAKEVGGFYGPMLNRVNASEGAHLSGSVFIGDVFNKDSRDINGAPIDPTNYGLFDFSSVKAIKQNGLLRGREAELGYVKNGKTKEVPESKIIEERDRTLEKIVNPAEHGKESSAARA